MKTIGKLLPIFLFSLIPTLLIWAPFFFNIETFWTIPLGRSGMETIVANYDGPLFLVVSKSLYNIEFIKASFAFPLPVEYYAAHFPLFPLLTKAVAFLTGYPYGMLVVTLASSFLAIFFFHKFISQYVNREDAYWLTFVFSLFPARWLIVRSVGSAEPLFVAAIIAAVYFFQNKKYLYAGLWGAVAQLTKSPGILLFAAFLAAVFFPYFKTLATHNFSKWIKSFNLLKYTPILLIPAALLAVFTLYRFTYGDFFAYFKSGDNIHLFFPPFQIFNYSQPWVGTFWLEEIIFIYLIAGFGLFRLASKKGSEVVAWFTGIFFVSLLFVSHRDILRYALPIIPFLFAAYSDILVKKEFKIAFAIIIIPVYLFSLAYISQNVMPIGDWGPFL